MFMRIMDGKTVKEVPMAIFLPHAAQAESNHYQSLSRLNERGGLHPIEAYAVLTDKPFREVKNMTQEAAEEFLLQQMQDYIDSK